MANAGPEDLPEGSLLGGRYRVGKKLGPTSMGAVFAAEDTRKNIEVALKVIWPSYLEALGDGLLKRFVREAHVSAALPSPHIVPVLSGAIDPATQVPYVVMPLLRGRDLEKWLDEAAPLDPCVAVRIAVQAGLGLRLAHEYGIVHRDIKPSNIFLEEREGFLLARVSDFGVAKIKPVDEQHITRTGSLLGSPIYMAPEQLVRPQDVDPRADVWSLAMTLYHMLAGKAPLGHIKSFADLVLALTQQSLPPLQDLAPWVSPGLATVVHGALQRGVDDRCPSIDAFLEALEPFAGGTTRLTLADLRPASAEVRAIRAKVAPVPSRWEPPTSSGALSLPPSTIPREADLEGHKIQGRFLLGKALHDSPTAILYEATDEVDGAGCVVKVFSSAVDPSTDHGKRYLALLERVRPLKNDHLARLIDFGVDGELKLLFVATERVPGTDLGKMLRTLGPLDPGAVSRVVVQVCQALGVVHTAGLAHENLKPSNILLQPLEDGRVVARLCDFGQPCSLEHADGEDGPAYSVAGQFALSPMYLSPEQVQGRPATHRSDLWSLALVLYEALAGRKPWQGYHSLGELLLAIQKEEIRPIRDVAPWVEGGVAEAIQGGLRRDPAQRYASVRELAFALGPFATPARSLLLDMFAAAKPSVVIRSDNASPLEKTALADSSQQARSPLPSTPPVQKPRVDPSVTMTSPAPGQVPVSNAKAVIVAVLAALLVVAAVAGVLLR